MTVHLRLRGADTDGTSGGAGWAGSPPPARSGHARTPRRGSTRGFTSACAERTHEGYAGARKALVHLRLRGADSSAICAARIAAGSPPPARSGQEVQGSKGGPVRFTSACAERTRGRVGACVTVMVHLRLRGADGWPVMPMAPRPGSPPPARSGHEGGAHDVRNLRFTSACAERTLVPNGRSAPQPVHLRLRGADIFKVHCPTSRNGSPPPARSGPALVLGTAGGGRFTSACAERTRSAFRVIPSAPVHLRLRGADASFQEVD